MPCFLEALKYLKASKKHPFETPGKLPFKTFAKARWIRPVSLETSMPWWPAARSGRPAWAPRGGVSSGFFPLVEGLGSTKQVVGGKAVLESRCFGPFFSCFFVCFSCFFGFFSCFFVFFLVLVRAFHHMGTSKNLERGENRSLASLTLKPPKKHHTTYNHHRTTTTPLSNITIKH